MNPTRFDRLARALAVGTTRRRLIRAVTGGIAAGATGRGRPQRRALAQPDATPAAGGGPRRVLDPIFVSPDPFPLGENEFLLDGKIFALDPDAAALVEGTPAVPILIDDDTYFINPDIAGLPFPIPEGTPAAGTPEPPVLETPCGLDDSQDVGTYLGNLGVTREFVDTHQPAVGNIRWNGNLQQIYTTDPGTVNAKRWCSGTLISGDLFLTAGHCFSQTPNGWRVPRVNGTSEPIPRAEIASNMHVDFNYQVGPDGNDLPFTSFAVVELVEDRLGDLDYAILRLANNPGLTYGIARIAPADAPVGGTICIIGHPEGVPKRIEAGSASQYQGPSIFYDDIDTAGGSSGSGILADPDGPLAGIHTTGGCTAARGGNNSGIRIGALLEASPTLRDLAARSA